MNEVWATGRRHAKISKLYLKALLRRGPNIFVALAWSQVSESAPLLLALFYFEQRRKDHLVFVCMCLTRKERTLVLAYM